MAKKQNSEFLAYLLYIIVGILLVIFRSQTLSWAMTFIGVFFIIYGVFDVYKRRFESGAVNLIIGIAVLVLGWVATQIVLLVLGVLIAIKGLIDLADVLKGKNRRLTDILYPVLGIVIGLILAFGNGLDIIIVITGVLLIVDGVLGMVGALKK